jgi:hypothetical protein
MATDIRRATRACAKDCRTSPAGGRARKDLWLYHPRGQSRRTSLAEGMASLRPELKLPAPDGCFRRSLRPRTNGVGVAFTLRAVGIKSVSGVVTLS